MVLKGLDFMNNTEEERLNIIHENLKILEEFLRSDDFHYMTSIRDADPTIKNFLKDIKTRIDTIKFFQEQVDVSHMRVVEESNVLASIICDYMGYE